MSSPVIRNFPVKMEQLRVQDIHEWREWLREHHRDEKVVWLVFRKKTEIEKKGPFDYGMALDEALCYGWVDSLIKRIDDREYMRKFTPRKPSSTWSQSNKRRVERLLKEGRMQDAGLKAIEEGKRTGMWEKGTPPRVDDTLPGALLNALSQYPEARGHYFRLSPSHQKEYNIWINVARRPETIRKRVEEAIRLLERGEELGLK